jgi:tRNA threonylcarbamoyl adenosine modification protein (Sua5/YciO/YrdC/YwlC family)
MIEISEKEFLSGKHDTLILDELSKDNLVIFPSESSYCFAGCAKSETVCKKIHKAKKQEKTRPISVIINDIEKIEDQLELGEKGRDLLHANFGTPLTVLFKKKTNLPCTSNDFVGVGIPLNKTSLKLCDLHQNPLTATSANIFGNPTIYSPTKIKEHFKDTDFVFINAGELKTRAPSTSYHFEENRILRAGEISLDEIKKVLK